MEKVTFTSADGVTTDYFPQSYTDSAVQEALAVIVPAPIVAPEATEVDVVLTDGTTKKFVPAA